MKNDRCACVCFCMCEYVHTCICPDASMWVHIYTHTRCIRSAYRSRRVSVLFQEILLCIISRYHLCFNYSKKNILHINTGYEWGVFRKYWTENYTRSHLKWFIVCIHIRIKVLCTQHRVLGKIQMTMTSWENKKRQTQNFPSSTYFQHQWHLLFSPRSTRLCTEVKVFFLHYSWRKHKHGHR